MAVENWRTLSGNSIRRNLLVLGALFFICLAHYCGAFRFPFMVDDHYIFGNPIIQNPHNIKFFFIPDKNRYLGINGLKGEAQYRPLTESVYALSYAAFKENRLGYHVVNMLFLVLACWVLFLFVFYLYADFWTAFLASVLFAVHPVNGLMVNYIATGVFALQITVMMLSIYCFLRSPEAPDGKNLYALSLGLFLVSLFFHETSMALPLFIICILLFHLRQPPVKAMIRTAPFFVVLFLYLLFRMKFASLKSNILDNFADFHITPVEYLATLGKVVFWYIAQLFYPVGIVLMWMTPVVRQNPYVWIAGLVLLVGLVFVLYKWGSKGDLSLPVAWLVLGFLPVAFACVKDPGEGFMMEPLWMTFASIGFFLFAALVIVRVKNRSRPWAVVAGALILAFWIASAHAYNAVWANEISYCRYWLSEVPEFKEAQFYLASAYLKAGRYDLARPYFLQTAGKRALSAESYGNLALIDMTEGKFSDAINDCRRALTSNPDSAEIYNNLGAAYRGLGETEKAKQAFDRALKINYFYVEPRLNLAGMAEKEGRLADAAGLYAENLKIDPYEPRSTYRLIKLLLTGKNDKMAADRLAKDFVGHSQDVAALRDLAGLLAQADLIDMALTAYEKALRLDPDAKQTYIELGKLFGNLNKFDEAIRIWDEALRLDPNDEGVRQLINQAQALRKAGP
jgi:tetratricopeptide (TPR) repeat protein